MSDDRTIADLALAHVRARMRDGVTALGAVDCERELSAHVAEDGSIAVVRVRRTTSGETREMVHLQTTEDPDAPIDTTGLETLDREVHRCARRSLRNRAIEQQDFDQTEPPRWSYTMHRLVMAVLREKDIDPLLLSDGWERLGGVVLRYMCEEARITLGAIVVEDGRIDPAALIVEGMEIVGHGRPAVILDDVLPATVVTTMAGRQLRDVLDHPAVRRAGPLRIEEAIHGDTYTTLILEDIQDFVRRPPKGVDRRWRSVPFKPHPDA